MRTKPRSLNNASGEIDSTNPLHVTSAADTAIHDAFARMRVSNPETIFDSKQIHSKQPLLWDESTTGTGAAGTWSQNTASTLMDVDASTAGTITRQTFRRFNYQPGKSQLILLTFVLQHTGAAGAGLIRQVGMFDDENGIFLEENEGTIQLVRRGYMSGSAVDTDVAQASWNIDTFDGTGASGVTIDWTKSQIMLIDMEWLGVGRVRVGFVIDGIPYYAHQFVHANSLAGVYMSTPNLPLRYYISNDGNYGSAAELEHICCSVMSEGGTQDVGLTFMESIGTSAIQANSSGTIYAVCGLRLKAANLDATVKLTGMSMLETASTAVDYEWRVIFNPTIAGAAPTFNDVTNSVCQFAIGSTANPSVNTVTGGTTIAGGLVAGGREIGGVEAQLDTLQTLGSDISGTPDEVWLCVYPHGTNADILGTLAWKEIS